MSDPATAYARAVLEGTILAGRAVRLACDRHVRDLARQQTDGFPFHWDPDRAAAAVEFFPLFLTLENGAPFALPPWAEFYVGSVFGWKEGPEGRRFKIAYGEAGKGCGKTPTLAGVGLQGLAFDDEPHAEIYAAAYDKGQAQITVSDALRMVNASALLSGEFQASKYAITHAGSGAGSVLRAVSADPRSKSGPRPHFVLVDELHEHRDPIVVNKMLAGFKGRRRPVLWVVTNAGHDRTSICWTFHSHSLDVLEGRVVDERWFAYVCQLDPCAACFADGYRQPKSECPACDSWADPAVWPKTNPALGITIQPEYLAAQVARAQALPSERALVQRLNFCLWTETHQIWLTSDQWDACLAPAIRVENPKALPCAFGLDLSSKLDLSALVIAVRIDDAPGGPVEQVVISGRDEAGALADLRISLNFTVEILPFFWLPEDTLTERVERDRIPYDVWREAGDLQVTPGGTIDHHAIYDTIVEQAKRFRPSRIGYDARDATMLATALRDRARFGDRVVEVLQGKRLSEAFKLIEVLVRAKRLRHGGNRVLAWNVANAEPVRDRLGALYIRKPIEGGGKKIDGVYALATAIHQLMVLPATARSLAGSVAFLGGR